ncbi:hypothetical protein [Apibacter adventoris]|nr:hypothetical protein [Apibacter adventoris]
MQNKSHALLANSSVGNLQEAKKSSKVTPLIFNLLPTLKIPLIDLAN